MSVKNNVSEEKKSADGYSTVPDAVSGVTQNARPADNNTANERPITSEKFKEATDALSSLMKQFPEFKTSDLAQVFHAAVVKGPEANERPLDQKNIPENPKAKPLVAKEDIDAMFGETLDEELKVKTQTIFEAHLAARIVDETAKLAEAFDTKLEEQVAAVKKELTESIDGSLDRAIQSWLEENKLAVEEGIKTQLTHDFITGLKGLFAEHHINVPEETLDVVKEYEERLTDLESKLNEEIEKGLGLQKVIEQNEIDKAFDGLSEGLAQTQVEKLRALTEGVEYTGVEEYKTKVAILKESTFGKKTPKGDAGSEFLSEEVETNTDDQPKTSVAPDMQAYVAALSRTIKK